MDSIYIYEKNERYSITSGQKVNYEIYILLWIEQGTSPMVEESGV